MGIVLMVGGLLAILAVTLLLDRNWAGLLLFLFTLFLVFCTGHSSR